MSLNDGSLVACAVDDDWLYQYPDTFPDVAGNDSCITDQNVPPQNWHGSEESSSIIPHTGIIVAFSSRKSIGILIKPTGAAVDSSLSFQPITTQRRQEASTSCQTTNYYDLDNDEEAWRNPMQPQPSTSCLSSSLCPNTNAVGEVPDVCAGICPLAPTLDLIDTSLVGQFWLADPGAQGLSSSVIDSLPKQEISIEQGYSILPGEQEQSFKKRRSSQSSSASSRHEAQQQGLDVVRHKERIPHKDVEKKYRSKINNQVNALRLVLPASMFSRGGAVDIEDIARKQKSKPAVLAAAIAYIHQLEETQRRMAKELSSIKFMNNGFKASPRCSGCSLVTHIEKLSLG